MCENCRSLVGCHTHLCRYHRTHLPSDVRQSVQEPRRPVIRLRDRSAAALYRERADELFALASA